MIEKERKTEVIENFKKSDGDTGGIAVQIALLTERINYISEHCKKSGKDYAARRGLLMLVGKRNRFLRYYARKDHDAYKELIGRLGLRK